MSWQLSGSNKRRNVGAGLARPETKMKKFLNSFLTAVLTFNMAFYALAQDEGTDVGAGLKPAPTETAEPAPVEEPEKKGLEQIISLDYKNADLTNVLRSMAWTYKLNVVTSPNISGKVTINLENITVRQALDAILTINGLAYAERAGIVYVSPGDKDMVDIQNEVVFLKYLSASEAQNLMRKLSSSKGDIKINEIANSLIVSDFPANIEKIKALLEKVDLAPQQVLIEAKIVDITSNDLAALGVTYNADYTPNKGGLFDRQTKFEESLDATLSMPEQSSSLTGGQFVLNGLTLKNLAMSATIDALVKEGKANLMASPSIAVLNGQEARIVIGERYPYKERTQTTSGTTETTKFVDIGTTLRVTPQINQDGYITMRIHPEVSSLAAALDAGPRITTREADTTVRVKEGETLIIGGLINQSKENSHEKIPFLGDIPLIGAFFSRSEKNDEQKELAVFITPKILRSREEKEKLAREQFEAEEVYVNIEETGELTVVKTIFDQAMELERGVGAVSADKDKSFRKAQALSFYENIFTEFPEALKAAEAAYRAGFIYYRFFKNYAKAKEVFAFLISNYPESKFTKPARRYYNKLVLSQKKLKKPRPMDLGILD